MKTEKYSKTTISTDRVLDLLGFDAIQINKFMDMASDAERLWVEDLSKEVMAIYSCADNLRDAFDVFHTQINVGIKEAHFKEVITDRLVDGEYSVCEAVSDLISDYVSSVTDEFPG